MIKTKLDDRSEIAELILARPDRRNALTRAMLHEMLKALNQWSKAPGIRAVLLTAEGPAFCAGMDLGEMQATALDPNAATLWREDANLLAAIYRTLLSAPWPVIASLQGAVVAGGVGLVASCDLVVASSDVTFTLPEPRRGIQAALVTPVLQWRVGTAEAARLLLTTNPVPANETRLVHRVIERPGDAVNEFLNGILSSSPQVLAATKQFLFETFSPNLLDQAAGLSAASRETPEAREGLTAFLEKRKPNWSL